MPIVEARRAKNIPPGLSMRHISYFFPNSKKALRRIEECTARAGERNRKQPHSARNLLPTKVFTNEDTAMTERISKDGSTRLLLISSFIFALLLVTGCQWSRGGTLPVTPNAQKNFQPRSSRPEPSATSPDITPASPVRFTEADFAQHVERLRARLKKMLPPSGAPVDSGSAPATEFSIVIQAP